MEPREAIVLREICSDGTEQYEMVCLGTRIVFLFATPEIAVDFAREYDYKIVEWIMD